MLVCMGAINYVVYYLDKKIPERNLRYSNPWIEGIFSVIYFLSFMLIFFLRKAEWKSETPTYQAMLWGMIIGGAIIVSFIRVNMARKKRKAYE